MFVFTYPSNRFFCCVVVVLPCLDLFCMSLCVSLCVSSYYYYVLFVCFVLFFPSNTQVWYVAGDSCMYAGMVGGVGWFSNKLSFQTPTVEGIPNMWFHILSYYYRLHPIDVQLWHTNDYYLCILLHISTIIVITVCSIQFVWRIVQLWFCFSAHACNRINRRRLFFLVIRARTITSHWIHAKATYLKYVVCTVF